jgi:protein-tyrosine phosphatase
VRLPRARRSVDVEGDGDAAEYRASLDWLLHGDLGRIDVYTLEGTAASASTKVALYDAASQLIASLEDDGGMGDSGSESWYSEALATAKPLSAAAAACVADQSTTTPPSSPSAVSATSAASVYLGSNGSAARRADSAMALLQDAFIGTGDRLRGQSAITTFINSAPRVPVLPTPLSSIAVPKAKITIPKVGARPTKSAITALQKFHTLADVDSGVEDSDFEDDAPQTTRVAPIGLSSSDDSDSDSDDSHAQPGPASTASDDDDHDDDDDDHDDDDDEYESIEEAEPFDMAPVPDREVDVTALSKGECLQYFDPVCSKLSDFLYLGSRVPAMNKMVLEENGITHILNAAGTVVPDCFPDDFEYTTLALADGQKEDISCLFYPIMERIEKVRREGKRMYVHCHAGVSRSSSFCIIYIMWANNWAFYKCHESVKRIRQTVNPNPGFMAQILKWWKHANEEELTTSILYRLVVHSNDTSLVCPRRVTESLSAAALDPRGVFVLHDGPNDVLSVWYGNTSSNVLREAAPDIIRMFRKYEVAAGRCLAVEIVQGGETPEFWAALGEPETGPLDPVVERREYDVNYGSVDFSRTRVMDDPFGVGATDSGTQLYIFPNNFMLSSVTKVDYERLYPPFDQADLMTNCLLLLYDSDLPQKHVYVWLGNQFDTPGAEDPEEFANDAAGHFIEKFDLSVVKPAKWTVVHESQEPPEFWTLFDNA